MDSRLPLQVYEVSWLARRLRAVGVVGSPVCSDAEPPAAQAVLKLAIKGCRQVYDIMRSAVKEHTLKLLAARGALKA